MTYLAKPSGILLPEHNQNLFACAAELFAQRQFIAAKYQAFFAEDVRHLLQQGIGFHDVGKAAPLWQNACWRDHAAFAALCETRRGTIPLTRYMAAHRYLAEGRALMQADCRHEIESLKILQAQNVPVHSTVEVAVAAHHGKLTLRDRHVKRWKAQKAEHILNRLACLASPLKDAPLKMAFLFRYRYDTVRGLLQYCDHRASAKEAGNHVTDLMGFRYEFRHQRRGPQCLIEGLKREWFAVLRAPTGSGKTDAAYLWAKAQIEELDRADRVLFLMPTRFTANALAVRDAATLAERGLYHSSAWLKNEERGGADNRQDHEIRADMMAARFFETPVTVATLDQACMALTGIAEHHHRMFANMCTSCIIIDESDFYDNFTQASILTLLRACRTLKIPVLLMSATVPQSAVNYYRMAGFESVTIHEDTSAHDKPRCHMEIAGNCADPSDQNTLFRRMLENGEGIVYCNTVKRAVDTYRYLRGLQAENAALEDIEIILYHSQLIEPDKARKEKQLLAALGKDAWAGGRKPRALAVLTQIGELSVNISTQFMVSDLCPADRMVQRIGRLGRFDPSNIGTVYALYPQKQNKQGIAEDYCAPYGTRDAQAGHWIPVLAYARSFAAFKAKTYTAGDFVEIVDAVYAEDIIETVTETTNRRNLEALIACNAVTLPVRKSEEGADKTLDYRPRSIPDQTTLYWAQGGVEVEFGSQRELDEFELLNTVSVYNYRVNELLRRNVLVSQTVKIRGGDSEKELALLFLTAGGYDSETGVAV